MKLSPFTYINANLSDRGITAAKLVEMVSSFAHAQGVTRVDLSDNPIAQGGETTDEVYEATGVEYEEDTTGVHALSTIKVKSLIMRNCELGPKAITALSSTLSKVAVVDILANPIGEDGFKTLIELFESTPRIQSMCGVQHGTKAADFSKRGLKPIDIKIIAHELSSSRSMAGVVGVDISGNPISGSENEGSKYSPKWVYDKDTTGLIALSQSLSSVKSLKMSNCQLGPKAISELAAALSTDATAGLETVDLSYNRFDPSLLDGIEDKVKLNLIECRA